MKKQVILRGLLGFPLGIALGYLITVVVSLLYGGGYYSPCVPALVESMGSEIGAVVLQTALCGLLGTVFAAGSVIWEMESWSIAKQTGLYFLLTALAMLPIAYFAHWMEHSVLGFASYFGFFIAIFVVVWLAEYSVLKRKIRDLNHKVEGQG